MNGSFNVKYTYADMLAATWLSVRKRWIWKGAARYIAVMTVIITAVLQIGREDHSALEFFADAVIGLVIGLVALAAVVAYWQWCIPRAVRKTYAQLQYEGSGAHFDFDSDGIRITDHTAALNAQWSQLVRWTESKRFILIYRTDYQCHYVPKEKVAPVAVDALRASLTAAVPWF